MARPRMIAEDTDDYLFRSLTISIPSNHNHPTGINASVPLNIL